MAGGSFSGWAGGSTPSVVGRAFGSMPYGGGPFGGVFPGTDYSRPRVVNVAPSPGSTDSPPRPTIRFDVIDFEGNLNPLTVKARVNGVTVFDNSQAQKFFNGWAGTVTAVSLGLQVSMVPPSFLGDAAPVNVDVFADDTQGNKTTESWSFTTYEKVTITNVRVLSNRCVELTFSRGLLVDGELFRASNYAFPVRLGYAAEVYAGEVTAAGAVPGGFVSTVVACMRDYFSLNGRYGVRVRGPYDDFGRVIDTTAAFTAG